MLGFSFLLSSEFLNSRLETSDLNLDIAGCDCACIPVASDESLLDAFSFMDCTFLADFGFSIIVYASNLATSTSKSCQHMCCCAPYMFIHSRQARVPRRMTL